jgi:hypothetical protein
MKIPIFNSWKEALYKVFVEFILLMDWIKGWLNIPLQVLTAAPALYALIIREREDVGNILEFLNHIYGDLRELILDRCWFGLDSTGLLANIVALYPDLEVLSLQKCRTLTSDDYCLIPQLNKLSELHISYCQVHYMYV